MSDSTVTTIESQPGGLEPDASYEASTRLDDVLAASNYELGRSPHCRHLNEAGSAVEFAVGIP
jgi:hypothetical protein